MFIKNILLIFGTFLNMLDIYNENLFNQVKN